MEFATCNEYYVPGSPIFHEDRKTLPITSDPSLTPKSHEKDGVDSINVSEGTVVITRPCTAPTCYTTTRSAAMMTLALGQLPKSPAASSKNGSRRASGISTSNLVSSCSLFNSNTANKPATSSVQQNHSTVTASAQLKQCAQFNGTAGTISGGSASSGSDNDGFNTSSSSSATALRRFYFKSGRTAKSKLNSSTTTAMKDIPMSAVSTASAVYHTTKNGLPATTSHSAGVPKVVIMGSSSASITDANINTSTDSASTLVTSVTHTDTSETCDSLDFGDNSGQSEPLFSSLEEPLLTAIQIDSEHSGNELELTSCSMYPRPDMNLQDSIESQESSLSIIAGEPSSTTPLLSSNRRHNSISATTSGDMERLPKTAPAPTSATKHFTFDPPQSPRSARTTEKSQSQFTFPNNTSDNSRQPHKLQQDQQQVRHNSNVERERRCSTNEERSVSSMRRDNSPSKGKYRSYTGQGNSANYVHGQMDNNTDDSTRARKKSRARDSSSSSNTRQRYSSGSTVPVGHTNNIKTSPKRESRRSPTSTKVNSAPPTLKDSNFFSNSTSVGKQKQLSPTAPHSRKYSSSSSSGGSERDRERIKDGTMFPFDRETIDYDRIQRDCFAVKENSSTTSSDSDDAESRSVYERKLSAHYGSPQSADIFQQYTLLSQKEQHHYHHGSDRGPPSRKNSKRIRPDSVMHATIRENQQYVQADAFYPQPKNATSPGEHTYSQHSPKSYAELNKFDEIASKFDQIPPKHEPNVHLSSNKTSSSSNNNNQTTGGHNGGVTNINGGSSLAATSPTGSMRGTTPPLPNLRVDFFTESQMQARKKSLKGKGAKTGTGTTGQLYGNLDECQLSASSNAKHGNNGAAAAAATGSINVTPNPMEAAVCTLPRATIVVQQPSLSLDNTVETLLIKSEGDFISVEQGKDPNTPAATQSSATTRKRNSQQLQNPPHHLQHHFHQSTSHHQQQQTQQKRDEKMRQLLDVTNTLTFEELRDFEMRYGSPHHSRSQSVKTPGSRASGRPNQLCLPQQRSRVASMPNTGVEEEYYRLRHFSITGKGVINRGDSLKSRRSRSNNSVASSNSSTEHLTAAQIPAPNSARTSATCSLASSRESSTSNPGSGPYKVLMLGGPAVGKSSLVSQFMTSEYLHAYDTSIDDDSGEKSVSVLLSGEESELTFIDHPYTEMTPDNCLSGYDPHGYCVIYSSADRSSFTIAEHVLQVLWTNQNIAQKAVILVANKADLARSRLVTSEEGKAMATAYDCKFIETSVGINHNVDELLVGLLSQIRLKLENPEKSRDLFRKRSIRKSKRRPCSPLRGACLTGGTNLDTPSGPANNVISDPNTPPGSAQSSPRKYRGSRTSTSLKVKGLLGRVWARDSKSKSCENLHVL